MITCDIVGPSPANSGLGNQLFCIAATIGLAEDNNVEASFSQLLIPPLDYYGRTIFHKLNKSSFEESEIYRETPYTSTIYNNIPYKKNMRIHGYFQSYKYFDNHREKILDSFQLPKNILSVINKKYDYILQDRENMVSLHIRRGDYVNLISSGHYASLDNEYYQKALDMIGKKNVVVFSDDIEWCKQNIDFSEKNMFFIEKEMDIVDLYLMSRMKDNIIANSTFSWWAAYMNTFQDKVVVGPKKWFGPNRVKSNELETKDLFPPDWIRI